MHELSHDEPVVRGSTAHAEDTRPLRIDFEVAGYDVARPVVRLGNLLRSRQRFIDGNRSMRDAVGESWSLYQLHNERADAI